MSPQDVYKNDSYPFPCVPSCGWSGSFDHPKGKPPVMKTYVIESSGGAFGNSILRVVTEKFIAQRGWQLVKTESGRKLLVDDKGSVEAAVVDEITDANAPTIKDEVRIGEYL